MKALHKGSLFSKWSCRPGRELELSRMKSSGGWGLGEGLVAQPQAESVVLFTFIWLCPSRLDITGHHLPLCGSETLYGCSSSFELLWGSYWDGHSEEIRSVKDSLYCFYRKRLDSTFAVLLVCPYKLQKFSSCYKF